jgi:hypothetical protein
VPDEIVIETGVENRVMILEPISKMYLSAQGGVADQIKMLTY